MEKGLNREGSVIERAGERETLLSISAVHQPFYISICIWTLPMQHTMFISLLVDGIGSSIEIGPNR